MKNKWRSKNISINMHILNKPAIGYGDRLGWVLICRYSFVPPVMDRLDSYLLGIRDEMINAGMVRQDPLWW